MTPTLDWPEFKDLPLDKSGPPGNAWGLWGKNDRLGRLNLITPQTVKDAASEITTGIRVSLDWPLNKPKTPAFKRLRFEHQLINYAPRAINDDVLTFNTQGALNGMASVTSVGSRRPLAYSVVAELKAYQETNQFYNGSVQDEFADEKVLGIDAWAEAGGITGRGILLDWYEWSQRNGKTQDPFVSGAIKFADLQEIIKEQNISIHPADVLFLRTGFVSSFNQLSFEEQENLSQATDGYLGLEATRESLRWLWDSRFSAVASDSPGFERAPLAAPYNEPGVSVHQWGLAGWGMPIGELFDLEGLATQCRELGRYSFFISSVPLKVPGGVASPPCAVAIF